jgi:hypothetical protein
MARILAARAGAVCPWRLFLLQPISGADLIVLISKTQSMVKIKIM